MLDSALFELKKAKLVGGEVIKGRELRLNRAKVKLIGREVKCKINCIEPRERLRLLLGGIQRSTS